MSTYVLYSVFEIISLVFFFFAIKYRKDNKKKSIFYFIFSLLPFALLYILRSRNVGTDYGLYSNAYISNYKNKLTNFEKNWLGVGFKFICSFFGIIFKSNYRIPFAIINIFTLFLFQYSIFKESKKPIFTLALLYTFCFHLQIFNQFRQFLSIAICFWSLKYLKKDNNIKYIISILVAATFHSSALILLIMPLFKKIKIDKKVLILYLMIGLFFTFGFGIIEWLINKTHYSVYIGSKYDIKTVSTKINFVIRSIMMLVCLIKYKSIMNNNEDDRNYNYLYHMIILCSLFQILAIHSYILARLTTYFYMAYIYLIPIVFEEYIADFSKKKNKIILMCLTVIVLFSYKTVYYFSNAGAIGGGYDKYDTLILEGVKK